MRRIEFSLIGVALVAFVTLFLVYNIADAQVVPGRYIVVLRDDVSNPRSAAAEIARANGLGLGHVYSYAIKGFSASIQDAALQAVERNPRVAYVEPDLEAYAIAQTLPTGVNRIDADGNTTSQIYGVNSPIDVDVAIIDTGIDIDHPDLNVVGGRRFYTVASGPPWERGSFEDDNYDDDHGHGSHVSGTVAAIDNGIGVVGIVPGARLWGVKVLNANGSGYVSDIVKGIDWVTKNSDVIEVANMSLGWQGHSSSARTAIQNSVNAGVFYAVAAGNDSRDVYGPDGTFGTNDDFEPASYPEVAAISAMADSDGQPGGTGPSTSYGSDDSFASFSNYSNSVVPGNPVVSPGLAIDLLMPGVSIYSTYKNGGYATMSGTSMASPHAAGLAALYIAVNGRASNAAGVYAIRQALIDGGVAQNSAQGLATLDDPDGYEENIGWAGGSGTDTPPTVTITAPANGATVSGTVNVTADASDDNGVTQVEFLVDGGSIGVDTDGSDGWSANWDTTAESDGSHTVSATATDTGGQTGSDSVSVTVDNIDDPPIVVITDPTDGATVFGNVTVTADASDDNGVTQVEFFVDGGSIGVDTDGSDGWSTNWDTTAESDGSHTVSAIVMDAGGQTGNDSVSVTVDNIDDPPIVVITDPTDGATVFGNATVTADASDDNGVTQVEFFVDGGSIGVDTDGSDGWSTNWDTTAKPDGSHTVSAIATDTGGQTGSDNVGVTVDNAAVGVTVTEIIPDTIQAGITIDNVVINGSGFLPGADVTFENGNGPTPQASNVIFFDSGKITATVTTKSGGPPHLRYWDVRVTNVDSSSSVLVGGLIVIP